MKIYISGPITGVSDFAERFNKAENKLIELNHEVINPAKLNLILPVSSGYNDYMDMCYIMLDMADAIVMLDGWEKSKGSCIEYGYALAKEKTVIDYKDILKWNVEEI